MNKHTHNAEYTKEYNRKAILRLLRRENLSRIEIARRTGLSRAAISLIAEELLREGMIAETIPVEKQGGRVPVPLMLLPETGYSVGVDLRRAGCRLGLVDICGTLLVRKELRFDGTEPGGRVAFLAEKIRELVRDGGIETAKIVGIGVSAPGPLDGRAGRILNPPRFDLWHGTEITKELEVRTGIRAFLENDASCLACYNLGKPEARGSENFLLVLLEEGVGSGVILDGRLLRGAGGFTSELGHISIDPSGPRCSCGNRGCLEMYAAPGRLLQGSPFGSWRELIDSLETSAEARAMLERETEYLSVGIGNLINLIPLDTVLLAGDLLYRAGTVIPLLEEKTRRRLFRSPDVLDLKILPARTGENVRVLSAAEIAFERFLTV